MPIRPAESRDAAQIAQVHVQAWRETYRGIMPDSLLDGLSVEQREAAWSARLNDMGERQFIAVAVDHTGDVVGFAGCGPARLAELGTDGEIYAINILERGKRQRAGSALMFATAEHLDSNGFSQVGLWVIEQNLRARAFYERLGGTRGVIHPSSFGGTVLTEHAYVWPRISDLLQRSDELRAARS